VLSEDSSDLGDGENFLAPYMVPKSKECLVDVGANVGAWTFLVARKGFEVYAFEPSPKAYNILNSRAKKYSGVHTFSCAIGDQDTLGRLGTSGVGICGTMDEENHCPGGGTIDVQVRRLDSLTLPKVGVIKIDTEGYEVPILNGAIETINRNHPRLVIEVHKASGRAAKTFGEELKRIEAILDGLNYSWILRHRPINLRQEMQPFVIATYSA
jgi:FkbM family methyltransferase